MVRIAFINPPTSRTTLEGAKHVPYGLAQLAAVADSKGAQVAVIDVNATLAEMDVIRDELKSEVKDYGPWDIIAMGSLVTTYGWQKEAAKALKKEFPLSMILAGGGCASSLQEEMLQWVPSLDVLCIGEGEKTLEELLALAQRKELMSPSALKEVEGIMYRKDLKKWIQGSAKTPAKRKKLVNRLIKKRVGDPQIQKTPWRPLMSEDELNMLPYPAWMMFPLNPSSEYGRIVPGYFANSALALSREALVCKRRLDIIGERGCPRKCPFCSHNLMGGDLLPDGSQLKPLVRWQSVEYQVEMIEWMLIHFKLDFISIMDENFTANRKRVYDFLDLLEDKDLVGTFWWGCLGRAKKPDEALLSRMRDDGCTYISYGYESSNQGMLNYLEKENTVNDQLRTLQATIGAQINPITTYIVGMPSETMQSLYDSARFWVKNGIQCNPFFYTPYPYTRAYWDNEEKILEQYDGDKEAFVLALGDATKFVVNLTKFTDAELIGLRHLMATHDLDRLRKHSVWRVKEGLDPEEELIVDVDPPRSKLRTPIGESVEGGIKLV